MMGLSSIRVSPDLMITQFKLLIYIFSMATSYLSLTFPINFFFPQMLIDSGSAKLDKQSVRQVYIYNLFL